MSDESIIAWDLIYSFFSAMIQHCKRIVILVGQSRVIQFIIKRIEVRIRLAVFNNRQCERDNGRLSVNSLVVIQIIRQAGVLLSKE